MDERSTAGTNATSLRKYARQRNQKRHDYSRVAGKLLAIFELPCSVVREAQELAEGHRNPAMQEIGESDACGRNGLLHDVLHSVADAASRAMDAANPDEARRIRSLRKRR